MELSLSHFVTLVTLVCLKLDHDSGRATAYLSDLTLIITSRIPRSCDTSDTHMQPDYGQVKQRRPIHLSAHARTDTRACGARARAAPPRMLTLCSSSAPSRACAGACSLSVAAPHWIPACARLGTRRHARQQVGYRDGASRCAAEHTFVSLTAVAVLAVDAPRCT